MENIPDSPEGIILESLLEGMNQYYSAELAQKVKRGMKETRLKGNYQGGTLPYGYVALDRKVVIDEEKAEVVRFIFDEYSKDTPIREIIEKLTAKGILNKGKPFAMNTIYGIVKNEKYSGTYMLGDELVDKIYPPIISKETYSKVQAKVRANRYGKRSSYVVYLLRNKAKCGLCGESIIAECGTSKLGERHHYYKCHGRKNLHNGCTLSSFRKDTLEGFVIDEIPNELNRTEQIDTIVKGIMEIQESQMRTNSTLSMLEREQRQNESAINNIMSAIERGLYTETANKRIRELEERQSDLERLILIERSKMQVKLTEREIRGFYTEALKSKPQMLINCFVKRITLTNDTIYIEYNNPLPKGPDEDQGFSFCDKESELTVYITNSLMPRKKKMRVIMNI